MFDGLAPGRGASHAFTTRRAQLSAGEVDLTLTPTGGDPVTATAPYAATTCGG